MNNQCNGLHLLSRLLNLFLVSLIITQPYQAMAGGITPDSQAASGNQPRMDQAANGVPVIDIAPATAAGVSHNQYRDFNVTSQGVILNNATGMSKTQLGGYIQANDRLKGRPARLILNEVTSANPSHLNGYMEIGGHGAEVVVANPNGISCNGCGFINTPQATLTTGIPQLSGGRLDAFAVDGGEVRIEGEGINAANIDKLSIISRAVVLNAKINARDLTLISGKNRVDATTHSILSSGTDGDAPTLSLDSSALGGMYANSIRLVGTEHGVGVHLPPELQAGSGGIGITAAGDLIVGRMGSEGDIQLNTPDRIDVNETLYAQQDLIARAGVMDIGGEGQLAAGRGIELTSTSFTNSGTVAAGVERDNLSNHNGYLTIAVADQLENDGTIQSTGDGDIFAGNLNNSGTLRAGGDQRITTITLNNQGAITAGDDLKVTAVDLENSHTLFAAGSMVLEIDHSLHNQPGGVILARDNLDIRGVAGDKKTDQLINESGRIEAWSGDLAIAANQLENRRTSPPKIITDYGRSTSGGWSREVVTETWTQRLEGGSNPAAQIQAGGTLQLATDTLLNDHSVIAAGEALELSGSITNSGLDLTRRTKTTTTVRWTERYCSRRFLGVCITRKNRTRTSTSVSDTTRVVGYEYATLQAGGDIRGDLTGLDSHGLKPDQGLAGHAARSPEAGITTAVAETTVDPLGPKHFALPKDSKGLFVINSTPGHPYLIESNPAYADFDQVISSDYMLNRLDLDPADAQQRLGDGFYELQLIRQSLQTLSGTRFLPGYKSETAQYLQLMDNALAVQQDLQLAVGIKLNARQINRLKSDIVWLVEREVMGRQVLVPVVYRARLQPDELQRGGQILAGGDIQLITRGDIHNSGSLQAGGDIQLQSENAIINQGGVINAGERVQLQADGDLLNYSGQIIGNDLQLQAGGRFENRTLSSEQSSQHSRGQVDHTLTQDAAQLKAQRDIRIEADQGVLFVGADAEAGGDIQIQTGGTLGVVAARQTSRSADYGSDDHYITNSVSHRGSRLKAGGSIAMSADQGAVLQAADITTRGNLTLTTGGDLLLLAATDQQQLDDRFAYDGGGVFGVEGERTHQKSNQQLQRTRLTAGGELTLQAGGEQSASLVIQAGDLNSEGQTRLSASGELALLADTTHQYESKHAHTEDLTWQSVDDEGSESQQVEMTRIQAEEGVTLHAGTGIRAEYLKDGSLNRSLNQLATQEGMGWVKQLQQRQDVDWEGVKAAHEEWDYHAQGLTGAAAAIISIAVAAVTAGAGVALAGTIGVESAVATTAMQTAITSISTQATLSLINNRGDLGAVLDELGSSASVQNLALAMVTAGASKYAGGSLDLLSSDTAFSSTINQAAYQIGSGVAIDTLVYGQDLDDALENQLRSFAVNQASAQAFKFVGDLGAIKYLDKGDTAWKDGGWAKSIAHAAAGATIAAISGGDIAKGAASAAVSELITPLTADQSNATRELVAVSVGTVIGGQEGGQIALNGEQFNRQLHEREIQWIEENAQSFADSEQITVEVAKGRLAQQSLKDVDFQWSLYLSGEDDASAKEFLGGNQGTFINEDQQEQRLFTTQSDDYLRPGKYLTDRSDRESAIAFYQKYAQSGITRSAMDGLKQESEAKYEQLKQLAESTTLDDVVEGGRSALKSAGEGVEQFIDHPWESTKQGAESAKDYVVDKGEALVDSADVAFNGSEDLKAFYGRDDAVTAQQVIAAGRVAGTIVEVAGAGKLVKSGVEYTTGKIDDAARRLAEQQQEWKFAGGEGDRSGNAGKGLPESYTRNFDGSITGPGGGRATDTGATTADGLPIYKRESGGYYTIGKNDKQEPVNSPSEHGNTLNREQTEIYIKRDADGNNEKIGISKDSATRYTQQELDGGKAVPIGNRPRVRAAEIERFMVERKPGPQNKEPWAGKRDPSHKNYDPDYVPPHMSKK